MCGVIVLRILCIHRNEAFAFLVVVGVPARPAQTKKRLLYYKDLINIKKVKQKTTTTSKINSLYIYIYV